MASAKTSGLPEHWLEERDRRVRIHDNSTCHGPPVATHGGLYSDFAAAARDSRLGSAKIDCEFRRPEIDKQVYHAI
jgi:hypothetical protein